MNARPNQFIGCDRPFAEAQVVLFGAPYDSTTSFRPGTRFGPSAMRSESFGIETYSMLQDRDIAEDAAVFDSGDLELPFGAPDRALEMIETRAAEILGAGRIPFLLGGEHLVTLGAVKLSHACVLRRCHDLLGDGRIFQFGIRSGTRDERSFMLDGHVTTELFSDATLPEVVEKIGREAPVYLTVDMDVLDPAEFPGTGTPEAGGLSFTRLVDDVRLVCSRLNVVALDNVELSPALDHTGRSTALACKFLREELLAIGAPAA